MAMGKRERNHQTPMWIAATTLPASDSHPFFARLNSILADERFEDFVEKACKRFYAKKLGRPSLAPGVYFRFLLIGYFEGIFSERGIAWRASDSISLRGFLGLPLGERVPDHSTISRTRRLIDVETHRDVFTWILKLITKHGLVEGKTLGMDTTTLEANAAMRSIIRRDTGKTYDEFLTDLAKASGIPTPTREDLIKLDKNRKNKGSNEEWKHPDDEDARIAKMKDGSTHLAHKLEVAVDMTTGAVVGLTVQRADVDDRATMQNTLLEATTQLAAVCDDAATAPHITTAIVQEVVADKGYHSNQAMADLQAQGIRSYISEPRHKKRNWKDKCQERAAVMANRRRIQGERGRRLMRKRGERVERVFAHGLETGNGRRTHVRGHTEVTKRMLIQYGALNIGLLMRKLVGKGTPRGFQSGGGARAHNKTLQKEAGGAVEAVFGGVHELWSLWNRTWATLEVSCGVFSVSLMKIYRRRSKMHFAVVG